MNHRLFEEWLLTDEPLDSQQKYALDEHLAGCQTCKQLSSAWREVERRLHESPQVSPSVGFVERWQDRLLARQLRKHRKQAFWMLAFYLIGALFLFFLLVMMLLPAFQSPAPILLALAYRISIWFSSADTLFEFVITFLGAIFNVVPATLWVGVGLGFCSLSVLWIVAFRQLTSSRRIVV